MMRDDLGISCIHPRIYDRVADREHIDTSNDDMHSLDVPDRSFAHLPPQSMV